MLYVPKEIPIDAFGDHVQKVGLGKSLEGGGETIGGHNCKSSPQLRIKLCHVRLSLMVKLAGKVGTLTTPLPNLRLGRVVVKEALARPTRRGGARATREAQPHIDVTTPLSEYAHDRV